MINKEMKPFFNKYHNLNKKLDKSLEELLNGGFKTYGDAVFFSENCENIIDIDMNWVKKFYGDISGYEKSTNKIYIDFYCDENIFENVFLFFNEFKNYWKNHYPDKTCIATMGIQDELDDEPVKIAYFSFYLKRPGEEIIDLQNLDKYLGALMAEEIGPDSTPDDGVES